VIEAMSAGLLCVHPNYGGLPDTAGGLNFMYQWDSNKNTHANKFYQVLDNAIGIVNTENIQNYLRMVKMYADSRYNWTKVASQWEDMLKGLKLQYPTAESRKVPGLMFHYKTS
jgi:hypothetical protein